MKKSILLTTIFPLLLLLLTSFSFIGEPHNIVTGKYILISVDGINPAPFYDDANEAEIPELLFISADGLWTLLLKYTTADVNLENELYVGRYQVKDDKVIFWDDTNCCSFTGKIAGDRLVVEPEGAKDNFLFVRMNSYK